MILDEISVTNEFIPGILDFIIDMHGDIYKKEFGYTDKFKSVVAEGLHDFIESFNECRERMWVCRHNEKIVGFILLADRGKQAQLRFFLVDQAYRGIGLGNKLMQSFFSFFNECGYDSAYLWTTAELETAAHLYRKFGFKLTEEIESVRFGKNVTEQKYEFVKSNV